MKPFQKGDKVALSVQWLKSAGMTVGELPHARGVVKAIQPLGTRNLIEVDWGRDDIPGKVLDANLAHVGPNRRFCNVD